ncbi:hypothetical protein Sste5344_003749 [Sporothrix stenoceras]
MGSVEDTKKLRIAVLGGGMAGIAAVKNFLELPNTEVTLYERATDHRLAGAWLGVTPSAQRTLSKWCKEEDLDRVIHYRYHTFTAMDWQTGEHLFRPEQVDPAKLTKEEKWEKMDMSNVVRSELHQLTLKLLPKEIVKTGKQSIMVEEVGDEVKVYFADGSEVMVDLAIAADGINSFPPRGSMAYTGFWDRYELKQAIPELPDDDLILCHKGCLIFMGYVGPTQYAIEAILPQDTPDDREVRWNDTATQVKIDHLIEYFKDWTPIVGKFFQFAKEKEMKLVILPRYRSSWLHKLSAFGDKLAFIGDAAHPTAGAFGSGTSFAYEDARTVFLGLQHAYKENGHQWTPDTVKTALKLYSDIRGAHYQKIEPLALEHEKMWNAELQDMSTEFSAGDYTWIQDHDADKGFADWVSSH